MKKLAVILGAAVMMLTAAVPAMANSSDSPTTDAEKTKNAAGTSETERKSPDTGEAPVLLGFGAAAVLSAAGIVVCLKKRVR